MFRVASLSHIISQSIQVEKLLYLKPIEKSGSFDFIAYFVTKTFICGYFKNKKLYFCVFSAQVAVFFEGA